MSGLVNVGLISWERIENLWPHENVFERVFHFNFFSLGFIIIDIEH